jgi:hypothetical protein
MKSISLTILLFCSIPVFAQVGNFNVRISKVMGDLNNDHLKDIVIVDQDTTQYKAPYRLQIYFRLPSGKLKLMFSSIKTIPPQYPSGKGGYDSGVDFDQVLVKNKAIILMNGLLRGNNTHKFRFQKGDFQLIGFSSVYSDGQGTLTTIDHNLSTGVRIEKLENYETDKLISKTNDIIRPKQIHYLKNFDPLEGDLDY